MLLNQKKIGVVFSEADVRLVDCVFAPDGTYRLLRLGKIERRNKNDTELAVGIRALMAEKSIPNHPASMTLPDQDFIHERFFAPKLPKGDIRKMIVREAKKRLNLAEKDILLDYRIGKTSEEFGVKKTEVCYLAAPRSHIVRHAEILMAAGLTPEGVVPSSMAMFHLMSIGMQAAKGPVSFIYLGENRSTIAVAEQDHIVFTRRLTLSPFESSPPFSEGDETEDSPSFDDAVREIKRTLLYCKKEIIGQDVSKVLIAAARPLSPERVKGLQGKLGVETLSPWHFEDHAAGGEDGQKGQIEKGYLFALGAAASAARKERLHLLPRSLKMKRYETLFSRIAASLLIFFLTGSLWGYFSQREKLHSLKMLAEHETAPVLAEEFRPETLERRVEEQGEMRARHEILSVFWHRRPPLQRFFQVLSQAMPAETYLLEAKIKQEKGAWVVLLNGKTFGRRGFDRVAAFSKWVDQLEASSLFEELVFSPLEDRPDMREGMPFQIRARFKSEAARPQEDEDA